MTFGLAWFGSSPGTGGALLGEPVVWRDFENHFRAELLRMRTVLLPHHGAAPMGGPVFYSEGLNAVAETLAVISVGTRNPPRPEVLKRVLTADGILKVVTEDWHIGFQEVAWSGTPEPAQSWSRD